MSLEEIMTLITEEPKEIKTTKFKATAYLERCLRGAIDGIDSDEWQSIAEFIVENLTEGNCVVVVDNTTNERKTFYPENLIAGISNYEELLNDLRLEQQEQM